MATDPPVAETFSYWLKRFADLKAAQDRAALRAALEEFEDKSRKHLLQSGVVSAAKPWPEEWTQPLEAAFGNEQHQG